MRTPGRWLWGLAGLVCQAGALAADAVADKPTTEGAGAIVFAQHSEHADGVVFAAPFLKSPAKSAKPLEALEGFEVGLTKGFTYGVRDYTDPFWIGRGTAAGDYDQDGWQDVVFGTNHGLALYRNRGGRFELQAQPNRDIDKFQVYAVALVDLNKDGWLDLFFTTFNKGNYVILNRQGGFDFARLIAVPNQNAVLTLSPAFGDLDLNGYLDIVNGNIALGVVTGFYHMRDRRNNSLVFNQDLEFRDVALESTSGETMASLISDINNDHIVDIYFGNDFIIPDKILLGTGEGYKPVTGNQFIAFTPFFSMGADTGDINNDLNLDFLVTGTMYMAPFVGREPIDGKSVAQYSAFKGDAQTCAGIKDAGFREQCRRIRETRYIETLAAKRNPDLAACSKAAEGTQREICLTEVMWQLIKQETTPQDCKNAYGGDAQLLEVCEILRLKERRYDKRDLYGAIPQDDRNMLYTFDPQSKSLVAVNDFKHPGGWTWNSRIADLDNDGWQDIITSDGTVRAEGYGWNVLMKNLGGKGFAQQQFSAGFAADFGLYSFVLIDMDNDGDLDVIGNSAEGPVQVYRNHSAAGNHSVAVSLVDKAGNVSGVGAKITIRYNGRRDAQLREIKAGGGYMSFDAPVAHFGLGSQSTVDEIEVRWADGSRSVYAGPFKGDQHYRLERRGKPGEMASSLRSSQ